MNEDVKQRQNTLFASLLLSVWAPLATGIAVVLSRSVTQLADFIRRTMEFFVLLLSWLVFRYLTGKKELEPAVREKWGKIVNFTVAAVLGVSGLIMLSLALIRHRTTSPGGNAVPGLIIAVLGLAVNLWFWLRYKTLGVEQEDAIIEAQRQLYLAKVFVDLCVITALGAVVFWPGRALTRYIDTLGSVGVALYLLWSAVRTWLAVRKDLDLPVSPPHKSQT